MKKALIIIAINGLFISYGQCQSNKSFEKIINSYDVNYQECLDGGQAMLNCSVIYYNQMDSMLNVVYKALRLQYSTQERDALKRQELKWIAARDLYFKKADRQSVDEGLGVEDTKMMALDLKAEFVRKRVMELVHRLKNK